jgi:hypothetical protein
VWKERNEQEGPRKRRNTLHDTKEFSYQIPLLDADLGVVRRSRSFAARLLDGQSCRQIHAATILSSAAKLWDPDLEDTELLRLDTSILKRAPREHHASEISRRLINAGRIQKVDAITSPPSSYPGALSFPQYSLSRSVELSYLNPRRRALEAIREQPALPTAVVAAVLAG